MLLRSAGRCCWFDGAEQRYAKRNYDFKMGNGLAVRIPQSVVRAASLSEGDFLSELVSRITVKNRHQAMDWGQPQGKETW